MARSLSLVLGVVGSFCSDPRHELLAGDSRLLPLPFRGSSASSMLSSDSESLAGFLWSASSTEQRLDMASGGEVGAAGAMRSDFPLGVTLSRQRRPQGCCRSRCWRQRTRPVVELRSMEPAGPRTHEMSVPMRRRQGNSDGGSTQCTLSADGQLILLFTPRNVT